jgi:hypothetical protein
MFLAEDIVEEAETIFGFSKPAKLYRWITDAVELLAQKGEIDPLVGWVDLCVDSGCITLPREIETVLACNIGGRPALGHDQLFSFHLNGPGDFNKRCDYTWMDGGNFPTYRDLKCPSKLVAFLDNEADAGKVLRVFGYDDQNRPLRTSVNGVWEDGYRVPTIFGYALPESGAPTISRITDVVKDPTIGNIRLSSFDSSTLSGTLLGVFEPDETVPKYRRLKVSNGCSWVRLHYRKRTAEVRSAKDRILLHSRPALILAMHALKFYRDSDLANGNAYEANATRLLTEREGALTSPVGSPIQVEDRNSIMDKGDAWVE